MILDPSSNYLLLENLGSPQVAESKSVYVTVGLKWICFTESEKVLDVKSIVVLELLHDHFMVC